MNPAKMLVQRKRPLVILSGILFMNMFCAHLCAGQNTFSRIDRIILHSMLSNAPDGDRMYLLKMMGDNFPATAPYYQQHIDQMLLNYLDAIHARDPSLDIVSQQQKQSDQVMGNAGPPDQTDIADEQQGLLNGKPPEPTARMKRNKELTDLLQESYNNTAITSENGYYNSPQYLDDLPNYITAKGLIKEMLEGKRVLSIKDAYYFAESAYGSLHLTYPEYNSLIAGNAAFIRQWLTENRYDLHDPEALHFGIQKFMSDTLYIGANEKRQGHIPYYYDYIDVMSGKDRRNYFVTKTLATGTGQCHTFPVTYLVLAEALGVKASLAYNPRHSFIRYTNNKGATVNYETTVDRFLPNAFYMETLPVMAAAQKNTLYVSNLSQQQVVASVLFDLAVNFTEEHWLADQAFIRECMGTATSYFPDKGFINTANNYLHKRLYAAAFNSKVQEKGIRDLKEIEKYPDVMAVYQDYYGYMEKVSSLGIQDFPESEYLRLLEYYDTKTKLQTARNINAKTKRSLFTN